MSKMAYQHLTSGIRDGVLVLTVTLKGIDDHDVASALRDELIDAVSAAQTNQVAVDLAALDYISSAGFLPLLVLSRHIADVGGELVLCNLSRFVDEVFMATRLISSDPSHTAPFQSEPTLTAAIARLRRTQGG